MKTIFTEKEIECGMFIIRNSSLKKSNDLSFARTVTFKIGFSHESEKKYGICNFLTDGFYVGIAKDKKDLCEWLNNDEIGYRPLTKDEVIEMIKSTNQGFY